VPEADAIARAFANAENQSECVAQMQTIAGAEFYLKIMERIREKGTAELERNAAVMKKNIEKRAGSRVALDQMKRRYNVITRFLPTPTPLPRITRRGSKKPRQEL
jgi:hypothetical protein